MGWSENNVCLKCNEGENLLTCRGCPLVIHEGCMGCSAKLDELGNFYCPHCSFKRSVAVLSRARKNVKLTRKALSIFMGIESKERNDESGAANVSMSSGYCEKNDSRTVELDDEGEAERGNENVEGEKVQEEESETPLASTDQNQKENSETYEESTDKSGEETGSVEGEKNQEEESEPRLALTDQTRKEKAETNETSTDQSGEREISNKDKEIGEEDCETFSDSAGGHRSTGHVRAKRKMLVSDSSCEGTPVRKKHVTQSNRIERSSPAVKCKHRSSTHSAQVTNKSSDEEFDDFSSQSRKWIHPKRSSVKFDNHIGNNQSRRVPWTEKEVEMLKAGVEKYSSPTKNLPWRKILHFGRHVFHEIRTPDNLRDKWRKRAS